MGDILGGVASIFGGGGGGGSSSQQQPSSSTTNVVQKPDSGAGNALWQLANQQGMQQQQNPFGMFHQQLLAMANPVQNSGIGNINSPSSTDLAASITANSVHQRQQQQSQFGF